MAIGTNNFVTAEEIRQTFYSSSPNSSKKKLFGTYLKQDSLTSTAKFVVKECRKRLGQQQALGSGSTIEKDDLHGLVELVEESVGEELTSKERQNVIDSLFATMDHYDILTPLVSNPEVNDIIIRNYKDICVQVGRKNIQTDLSFSDHDTYCAFVENLLKRSGKACTLATPVVDTAVNPNVRACVTHESFSPPGSGPMLTLRIARHNDISLTKLEGFGLAPKQILSYLAAITKDGKHSILIAGEVGTGKTTLVRALAAQMQEDEAILIIEDTNEIVLNRHFVRTLLTREANTEGAGRISPAQAIRTGMRMAMNRVILGEMRCAEAAEAFIDVCASGHAGISTIHARSAKDALARLELFLARAQGNISTENIRKQIANAIGVVVYLGLDKLESKRRILEVIEVGPSSDGVVQVSPLFSCQTNDCSVVWKRGNGISHFSSLLDASGLRLALPGEYLPLMTSVYAQDDK